MCTIVLMKWSASESVALEIAKKNGAEAVPLRSLPVCEVLSILHAHLSLGS